MADPNDIPDEQFKNTLAQMLESHAAGNDVAIPQATPQRRAMGPVGAGVEAGAQDVLKNLGQSALTEARRPKGLGDVAETGLNALPAGASVKATEMLGGVAQKLLKYAQQNPQKVKALLGSLGLLGGTTQAARSTGPIADPQIPGSYGAVETKLRADIKTLEDQIEAVRKRSYKSEGGGYNRRTGEHTNPTRKFDEVGFKAQTENDQAHLDVLRQQLSEMEYEEKPFLEKHPNFPEEMVSLGGSIGGIQGARAIQAANRAKKPFAWWQKAGLPGVATGIPEALLAVGVPGEADRHGVGRAKEAADKRTWSDIFEDLALETGEAGGASGIGYKLGSLMMPTPIKGMAKSGATSDILDQIENIRANDLRRTFGPRAAPAAAAPPVAAAPAAPQNVKYNKLGMPYEVVNGRIRKVPGLPYRKPQAAAPTAANPQTPNTKTIPAQTVVPTPDPAKSSPLIGILKMLGGPENR